MTDRFTIPIECRADETREGPGRIVGTILETGRVAVRPSRSLRTGRGDLPVNGRRAATRGIAAKRC